MPPSAGLMPVLFVTHCLRLTMMALRQPLFRVTLRIDYGSLRYLRPLMPLRMSDERYVDAAVTLIEFNITIVML